MTAMTEHAAAQTHVFKDADVLVVYASTHGHTAKIATRIAAAMRADGLNVDLRELAKAETLMPGRYDLVVVAASVHRDEHQKEIAAWVSARHEALSQMPSVFLSVSLTAAEDSEESRAATQHCIDEFLSKTGWAPARSEPIAGSLQYREYDVFTRQLMRLLMKKMGHPTDASHDYDYTDWDRVEALGHELGEMAAGATIG